MSGSRASRLGITSTGWTYGERADSDDERYWDDEKLCTDRHKSSTASSTAQQTNDQGLTFKEMESLYYRLSDEHKPDLFIPGPPWPPPSEEFILDYYRNQEREVPLHHAHLVPKHWQQQQQQAQLKPYSVT